MQVCVDEEICFPCEKGKKKITASPGFASAVKRKVEPCPQGIGLSAWILEPNSPGSNSDSATDVFMAV
jgi:hypothetical protein